MFLSKWMVLKRQREQSLSLQEPGVQVTPNGRNKGLPDSLRLNEQTTAHLQPTGHMFTPIKVTHK